MKNKLFLLLIMTFGILLIPKNGFAKTLEINLPSNRVSFSQEEIMSQYYSARETFVLEMLSEYFCYDSMNLLSGDNNGGNSVFPYYYNFGLEETKNNNSSLGVMRDGSDNAYMCTIRNLDNDKEIFNYVVGDDYLKYELLSNVSDDDLLFSITDDFRNYLSSEYAFMLYGYDSIRINFKQIDFVENNDIVYDFTKYNDYYDMSFYDIELIELIFGYFTHIDDDPNFPIVFPENYGHERLYSAFNDRNGKELFKIYYNDINNNNLRSKIVLADGVSYKDNFTYVLPSDLKSFLSEQGFHVNSISFRFGDEPKEEAIVEKVKNIVSNPKTYSGMFIVFIVLICSLGGFALYKRINNN